MNEEVRKLLLIITQTSSIVLTDLIRSIQDSTDQEKIIGKSRYLATEIMMWQKASKNLIFLMSQLVKDLLTEGQVEEIEEVVSITINMTDAKSINPVSTSTGMMGTT